MSKKTLINSAVAILLIVFLFNSGEFGRWFFVGLLVCVGIRIIVYVVELYMRYRRNKSSFHREYFLKMTAWMMFFFFISGTIVFIFDLPYMSTPKDPQKFNNVELILRSIICSLDMFMLDVDSNILDNLGSYPTRKGIILIQAAFSFVCTVTLLVSLIFSRIKAYYVLHRQTRITDEKNHLYLFFGLDDNSRLLAHSVACNDPRALTIFVDEANIKDDENDSWENIVTLFTHRPKTFEIAEEAHALVAIGSKSFSDLPDSVFDGKDVDVFTMVGLGKVKQLIEALPEHASDAQLHVFFLSDDEDRNIRSLINLAKDSVILNSARNTKITHRIYCHARYNGPNRIIEDIAVRMNLDVEIVDSSHLSVELIKSRSDDQPVRVATFSQEYTAAVTSALNCLIVGFGEVGRDAFRYLYEFGTFIKVKDGKEKVSRPNIVAVDKRMDVLSGLFRANTPSVHYNTSVRKLGKFKCNLLKLDVGNYRFYDNLLSKEQCEKLNYVILALGDDDRNIALATNIFNRIRRYRSDMSNLIIMVRCIKGEKVAMMEKVSAHFNKGCGCDSHDVIRLFGQPKDIYSYSTIIREDLTRKGMAFFKNYVRIRNEEDSWNNRRARLTKVDKKESGEIGYPNIDNLRKLRRQESQDMSNALHVATKIWILKKALGKSVDWLDFVSRFFSGDGLSSITGSYDSLYYPYLTDEENLIMLRLAQLEHARWNAAHEMLGYENNLKKHSCEERTQLHNCLKTWEELDEESVNSSLPGWTCDYKAYDFSVIDTSIAIEAGKQRKETNSGHDRQ